MSPVQVPVLVVIGALLGTFNLIFTSLLTSITLGAFLGEELWHACFNELIPGWHVTVVWVTCVLFTIIFWMTRLGPLVFEAVLVPCLTAAMLVCGGADFFPSLGALDAAAVFSGDADAGAARLTFYIFAGLAFVVGLLQFPVRILFRKALLKASSGDQKNDHLTKLLPEGTMEGGLIPRPANDKNDGGRFQRITKAIFAEEGEDTSYLTEDERRIVDVCRMDEFERDRVIWGGGLL